MSFHFCIPAVRLISVPHLRFEATISVSGNNGMEKTLLRMLSPSITQNYLGLGCAHQVILTLPKGMALGILMLNGAS